jgi:hypothetical protein
MCYDARSHERKILIQKFLVRILGSYAAKFDSGSSSFLCFCKWMLSRLNLDNTSLCSHSFEIWDSQGGLKIAVSWNIRPCCLYFYYKDGDKGLLWNVSTYLLNCVASYSRRTQFYSQPSCHVALYREETCFIYPAVFVTRGIYSWICFKIGP